MNLGDLSVLCSKWGSAVYDGSTCLYLLKPDGSLCLNVTKDSFSDIKKRIPETKMGLEVVITTNVPLTSFSFFPVTRFDRFETAGQLNLRDIYDNGEPTLGDWLNNRKNYLYTIALELNQ